MSLIIVIFGSYLFLLHLLIKNSISLSSSYDVVVYEMVERSITACLTYFMKWLKENIGEILDSCIAAYDNGAVLLLNLDCFSFTISG
jgi:hypothetical protein